MSLEIRPARGLEDYEAARGLFRELAKWYLDDFNVDVEFQGFSEEVRGLPGHYAPPEGELLVASNASGLVVGCVALRPFEARICEIKRLYVTPAGRGSGAGWALASAIIEAARGLGYERAVLDTASFMKSAAKIYESLGFRDIPPYYDNPYAAEASRVRFLGREL